MNLKLFPRNPEIEGIWVTQRAAQGEVFLHPSWNNFRAAIIAAAAETVPNSEIWRWRCMSVVSGGSEVADGEKMFWKVEKMKADDNKNTHVLLFS